jgi:hypothetical protein
MMLQTTTKTINNVLHALCLIHIRLLKATFSGLRLSVSSINLNMNNQKDEKTANTRLKVSNPHILYLYQINCLCIKGNMYDFLALYG